MAATAHATNSTVSPMVLTDGQAEAKKAIIEFLLHPTKRYFRLAGYAGTGKTTLLNLLLDDMPAIKDTFKLFAAPGEKPKSYDFHLTATTNPAATVLSGATKRPASTIHSLLGLKIVYDYHYKPTLEKVTASKINWDSSVVVIDEAGMLDYEMLDYIDAECTPQSKVIMMYDPAQLPPVGLNHCPIHFKDDWGIAELTEVVRQAKGSRILELATNFRNGVKTGEIQVTQLNDQVQYIFSKVAFRQQFIKDYEKSRKEGKVIKLLGHTNKTVLEYNKAIRMKLEGNDMFIPGDYAICNTPITVGNALIRQQTPLRISQVDQIKKQGMDCMRFRIEGYTGYVYMTKNTEALKRKITALRSEITRAKNRNLPDSSDVAKTNRAQLKELVNFADLRDCYACTVHKAQGMTCDTVYIDLTDLSKYNAGKDLARLLYVAATRAKSKVVFTGLLPEA